MGFTQGLGIPKAQPRVRLEMIKGIKLEGGSASEEKYEYFTFWWKQYKTMVDIVGKEKKNLGEGVFVDMTFEFIEDSFNYRYRCILWGQI